jgi:hypothetical protein
MNQHEWVAGCLAWYREADLVPGNPEDGVWEACHYPVPKCLGGMETVLLLKEHHAVQGVLQSEEYQRRCIRSWELAYLEGELLALARKWISKGGSAAVSAGWAGLTPEERSARARRSVSKGWAKMTPEERAARMSRYTSTGWAKLTPEERTQRIAATLGVVPVEVTHPDGTITTHVSQTAAALATGVHKTTVCQRIRTGTPTRTGYTYRAVP